MDRILEKLSESHLSIGNLGLVALAAIFLYLHWHGLPFMFHIRTGGIMVRGMLSGNKLKRVDEPVEHHETVLLSDMDFNIHMNNAIYPVLGDYVRSRLFLSLYGTLSAFRKMPIHNAGVATLFLREFRFLDPIVVRARIVSVEERKWLYVLLEYIHGRTKRVHALALTKMVFKSADRKTVPPREALQRLGYEVPADFSADTTYGPLIARLQSQMECDGGWEAPPLPGTPANDDAAEGECAKKSR